MCIFSLMNTTVFYLTALRKYQKFCLMPLFVVLSRDYCYEISCYFKVTLVNKTNGGDMQLFWFSLRPSVS